MYARRVTDVVVIGAGPNGLVAACHLAEAGLDVLVLEAQAELGGACRSSESTLPGFVHDVGAAFFPFAKHSPALASLELASHGLVFHHAPIDSAHPALDGSCGVIARDLERCCALLGDDGPAWREVATWYASVQAELLPALLSTFPPLGSATKLGPSTLLRLARVALSSGRGYAESLFRTEAARRMLPGLALHTDVGPDDPLGAIVGFMLAVTASYGGFAVPEGGAGAITRALAAKLASRGGVVRTGARVSRVITRGGRAVAVRTEASDEIEARSAIVADVAAEALYLRMLSPSVVPSTVLDSMRRFQRGFGTFKVDWALDGPVPWSSEPCLEAAVVHPGESNDDLARFTDEVRRGLLPELPYLVVGQQSLVDPTRAPEGQHTLWAYSRVPSELAGGWTRDACERFADRVDARIEGLAPGFRARVRARHLVSPVDLERLDENLLGGDLGGGTAQIQNQLLFRPSFPYFRYRTPVRGLYLGSSYAHPGAGVHGACGHNAALAVLSDLGVGAGG